jgi:hypothetical protein
VNLTRFNLLFPEKRDFFLEGQGLFTFGGVGGAGPPLPGTTERRRRERRADDLLQPPHRPRERTRGADRRWRPVDGTGGQVDGRRLEHHSVTRIIFRAFVFFVLFVCFVIVFRDRNRSVTRASSTLPRRTRTLCRRDLFDRDGVYEAVRIQAIEPAVCRFALRVHEVAERGPLRAGQPDVVCEVVGDPVHLPRTE